MIHDNICGQFAIQKKGSYLILSPQKL